jgi:hypothetical protein
VAIPCEFRWGCFLAGHFALWASLATATIWNPFSITASISFKSTKISFGPSLKPLILPSAIHRLNVLIERGRSSAHSFSPCQAIDRVRKLTSDPM